MIQQLQSTNRRHRSPAGTLPFALSLVVLLCMETSSLAQTSLFADINKTGSKNISGPLQQLVAANDLLFFVNGNNVWRTDGTSAGTFPLVGESTSLSDIRELTSCGNRIYFVATSAQGRELWVSFGNYASIMDINKQNNTFASSDPMNLTNVNGVLYFSATDGLSGREPWRASGSGNDYNRVADIIRGSGGSNPSEFEGMNGEVYFTANDGTNGYELWKTNGVSATLVKDVRPGSKLSSTPKELTNVNGTLYFTAYDATRGRELWKSNGTATGTVLVKDIRPGTGESVPDNLTAVGNTLYFGANDGTSGRELWKSNGTATGTVLVKDLTPGPGSYAGGGYAHLSFFTVFNGTLYFMGYTDRPRMWKTDGTDAGTIPVTPLDRHFIEINPNLTVFNGALYYVTNDNFEPNRGTMQIWRTNGTPADHEELRSGLGVWQNDDMELTVAGNKMFFTSWEDYSGTNETLWQTDGTTEGTDPVASDANSGSSTPAHLTTIDSVIYFSANNGIQAGLFKTNGTVEGTVIVKDIPGELHSFFAGEHMLFFIQRNGTQTMLWRSDGTDYGTLPLLNLYTTNTQFDYEILNNGLVFLRSGDRLWRSNGTPTGTYLLKTFPSAIGWIAEAGEELLLAADDGVRGLELWRSDGTISGTVLQRDIFPGFSPALLRDEMSEPKFLAAVTLNDVVYFLANAGGDANYELWRSDGTGGSGTRMLKNDETGKPFTPENGLAVANNQLFLFTYEGTEFGSYLEQRTLWASNGTTSGTVPIFQYVHDQSTGMLNLHKLSGGEKFYFLATTYLEPAMLYASDGTEEGTSKVFDFGPMESAGPIHTAFDGNKTYISSGHMYDKFLIRSDGTACGTSPVPYYSNAETVDVINIWLAVLNGDLYMNAYTEQFGEELYRYRDASYAPCAPVTMQREVVNREDQIEINAHPNPFARTFDVMVATDEDETFSLEVTGFNGMLISRMEQLGVNIAHQLGEEWKPGIYILKVKTGNKTYTRRLIKQNE